MPRILSTQAYDHRFRVQALYSQGLGYKKISKETGLSIGSVRNYLARSLPSSRPKPLSLLRLS